MDFSKIDEISEHNGVFLPEDSFETFTKPNERYKQCELTEKKCGSRKKESRNEVMSGHLQTEAPCSTKIPNKALFKKKIFRESPKISQFAGIQKPSASPF